MANLNYDAANNIVQTIPANSTGFIEAGVIAPLINAAVNGFVDPTSAPNVLSTSGGAATLTPISVNITNGSGQIIAQWKNPA